MFKYKTIAEIEAMDAAQKDTYATEKRNYEAELVKQEAAKQVEEALKGLPTKADLDALNEINRVQGEEITELKEKAQTGMGIKKGVLSDFIEKNVKEAEDLRDLNDYGKKNFTVKAPALMTTANVKPISGGAFNQLFNNYVDSEVGHTAKPDTFIMDLVNVKTQPNAEKIWWVERENEEGNAEFIAEGDLAPLADGEYQQKSDDMYEAAVAWKFSKRLITHAPSVESDFREHANELVEQELDDKVLLGDNSVTSTDPNGITTVAGAFIAPTALANYYTSANIYDAINACATRVRLNNFKGQITCVLGTVWEARMKGIKDKNDNYILPHFVTPDGRNVGSVKVEFQNKMPEDNMLIGDLKKFNVVVGDDFEYSEFYENDDQRKRLITKMIDGEFGTYIKGTDLGAIIYNDIADVLDQIEVVTP